MNLLNKLRQEYSEIKFTAGDDFSWSPKTKEIYYMETKNDDFNLLFLHEVAHFLLEHEDYHQDIELVQMESNAWDFVELNLAKKYSVNFNTELAQNRIDSYRAWMHKRSLCPDCGINGFQKADLSYNCIACGETWLANSAKFTQLKRRRITQKNSSF